MRMHSPPKISPRLREYVHTKLGLFYTEKQDEELVQKLKHASKAFGFHNISQFSEWLLVNELNDKQTGDLASHLTIGETYFFREKKSFDFLEQIYLPGLIRKRIDAGKRLRIWCAGCATGEEAYSLAIAVSRTIPEIHLWDITILATDINQVFLEKAQQGIYTKWSFRTCEEAFKQKYFTKEDKNEYHIRSEFKRFVKFSWLNLMSDSYQINIGNPQSFDIIFCRNVLIYFSQEGQRQITEKFYNNLVKGGILVVSPVEMMSVGSSRFNKIFYSGFTLFQKGGHTKTPKEKPAEAQFLMSHPFISKQIEPLLKLDEKSLNQSETIAVRNEEPNSTITLETAESLILQGSLHEAEMILNRLHESGKNQPKALLLMAKIKANQGKLKEAEHLCKRGIILDRLDQNLYYLLATVQQEQGEDELAVSLLKQAIYIDPDFVLAHFLLGTLNLKQGNHDEGLKSFKRASSTLSRLKPEELLPESDGITAARFSEIMNSIRQ